MGSQKHYGHLKGLQKGVLFVTVFQVGVNGAGNRGLRIKDRV